MAKWNSAVKGGTEISRGPEVCGFKIVKPQFIPRLTAGNKLIFQRRRTAAPLSGPAAGPLIFPEGMFCDVPAEKHVRNAPPGRVGSRSGVPFISKEPPVWPRMWAPRPETPPGERSDHESLSNTAFQYGSVRNQHIWFPVFKFSADTFLDPYSVQRGIRGHGSADSDRQPHHPDCLCRHRQRGHSIWPGANRG